MSLLSGFNVTLDEMKLMADASAAAFAGGPVPSGWTVVTPQQLGVAPTYWDGNYFTDPNSGASAIVLQQSGTYIVAFRGTDGQSDVNHYQELFFGTYIGYYQPLLSALAGGVPGNAHFYFTGASLGGGATNLMAGIAGSQYSGRFAAAQFVAFASPNITNASGILNVGFENDPVYKLIPNYGDFASSLDNLVLASPPYMAGNYDGQHPFDVYAHTVANVAGDGFDLSRSAFVGLMSPDSVLIIDAVDNGLVQDVTPGRENTGAFYLGQLRDDQISGRNGNDYIEGFAGNDLLTGGGGNDMIDGGLGSDTAVFTGARADYQVHTMTVGGAVTTLVKDGVGTLGTDTATNVETLRFADGDVTPLNAQSNLTSNVDGARFDDVIYRSVLTGQVIFQNMNAGVATGFDAVTNPLSAQWTPIGTGDVSGDGKADVIIWNSANGFVYSALPGASAAPTYGLVAGGISGTYSALGVSDINGDGLTDLLVREANSGTVYWQNTANSAWDYVGINIGSAWNYQAAGDVNHDGYSDVVIRHTSGLVYIANMAGGHNSSYFDLGNISGYQVRTVADVNADGFADVVVQRESDGWTLWRDLSGHGPAWNVASNPVGTSWIVKDAGDVDNDGSADLIYQNASTGETLYRAMDHGVGTNWFSVSGPVGTEWVVV